MDKNILEFITFAIGSVAERLQKSPSEIYKIFRQSNVLAGYLIPEYDELHTFVREYLVDDVLDFMKEKGVKLC